MGASSSVHPPRHVAIIMDGNGRWATAHGLSRLDGHIRGAAVLGDLVGAAQALGIRTLTLYAFSADNWRRPGDEILGLMSLFEGYLRGECDRCVSSGTRVSAIGRRDRLSPSLRRAIEAVEAATADGPELHLRLAIDYSSRDAIWSAVDRALRAGGSSHADFVARVASGRGERGEIQDVDLVIRTGGEQRLSDFLLWESAYAELWFTEAPWPDFTPGHLREALAAYAQRQRRFGGVHAIGGNENREAWRITG